MCSMSARCVAAAQEGTLSGCAGSRDLRSARAPGVWGKGRRASSSEQSGRRAETNEQKMRLESSRPATQSVYEQARVHGEYTRGECDA